jgi:Na+-driven multidrug efflux pump
MIVALLAWLTGVLALVAAAFAWRDYRRARDRVRRMLFLVGAIGFVVVAVTESCLAIWH